LSWDETAGVVPYHPFYNPVTNIEAACS
jgi:hypothetical protein